MSIQRKTPLILAGGLALAGLGTPEFWPAAADAVAINRVSMDQVYAGEQDAAGVPDAPSSAAGRACNVFKTVVSSCRRQLRNDDAPVALEDPEKGAWYAGHVETAYKYYERAFNHDHDRAVTLKGKREAVKRAFLPYSDDSLLEYLPDLPEEFKDEVRTLLVAQGEAVTETRRVFREDYQKKDEQRKDKALRQLEHFLGICGGTLKLGSMPENEDEFVKRIFETIPK